MVKFAKGFFCVPNLSIDKLPRHLWLCVDDVIALAATKRRLGKSVIIRTICRESERSEKEYGEEAA